MFMGHFVALVLVLVASAGSTSSRGTDEGYWLPVTVRREREERVRREKGEERVRRERVRREERKERREKRVRRESEKRE